MGYEAERFDVDGLTVRIMGDDELFNPRTEHDNFGTMVCFHRRYNLGDKHNMTVSDAQETVNLIIKEGGIVLPLYLYDHSGITMSTSAFSCPWDSGQVGFMYATAEDIRKEYSCKRISKKIREKATALMVAGVEEYDDYLTGNCYGFILEDPHGEHLDSCWGFLGDIKYCREEATSAAQQEGKRYFTEKRAAEMKYGEEHNA